MRKNGCDSYLMSTAFVGYNVLFAKKKKYTSTHLACEIYLESILLQLKKTHAHLGKMFDERIFLLWNLPPRTWVKRNELWGNPLQKITSTPTGNHRMQLPLSQRGRRRGATPQLEIFLVKVKCRYHLIPLVVQQQDWADTITLKQEVYSVATRANKYRVMR